MTVGRLEGIGVTEIVIEDQGIYQSASFLPSSFPLPLIFPY